MTKKLAALLKKIGPSPDRIIRPTLVVELVKFEDAATIPWLLGIMNQSSSAVAQALTGLRAIGDPAAVPGIRAWMKTKRDQPHLANLKVAKDVSDYLAKRGPVPAGAAARPVPTKPRSRLVYQKLGKPPKRRAPRALAAQWTAIGERFARAGLPARAKDVATEGVVLWTTRADEKKIAVGATKIGGHPDLPAGTTWPRHARCPMTFIAQIDLASIAKILDSELPSRGLLSFFVIDDLDGGAYLDKCTVIYSDGDLTRFEVPDDFTNPIYQACKVEPHAVVKLPGRESAKMRRVIGKQVETYGDDVFEYLDPENQLLGARDHDIDAATRVNERLLLQIKSDSQAAMNFGDADVLSFLIPITALAAHDFRKVRLCLMDE